MVENNIYAARGRNQAGLSKQDQAARTNISLRTPLNLPKPFMQHRQSFVLFVCLLRPHNLKGIISINH